MDKNHLPVCPGRMIFCPKIHLEYRWACDSGMADSTNRFRSRSVANRFLVTSVPVEMRGTRAVRLHIAQRQPDNKTRRLVVDEATSQFAQDLLPRPLRELSTHCRPAMPSFDLQVFLSEAFKLDLKY